MGMLTKAWSCPACAKEFIVSAEATEDTCPWCRTSVEERSGELIQADARARSDRVDVNRRPAFEYDEQVEATLFPDIVRRSDPDTPSPRRSPGQGNGDGRRGEQDDDAPVVRRSLAERTDAEQVTFVDYPCSAQQAIQDWSERLL